MAGFRIWEENIYGREAYDEGAGLDVESEGASAVNPCCGGSMPLYASLDAVGDSQDGVYRKGLGKLVVVQDVANSVSFRYCFVVVGRVFCPRGAVDLARRDESALPKAQHGSQDTHVTMLEERGYRARVGCRTAAVVYAVDARALGNISDW